MLPVVKASVGKPLPISRICEIVAIPSDSEIRSILQRQIRVHFSLFGTEPYKIEYSRSDDSYQLRPNGVVGRILCGEFILEITSKFENIDIGKWLQLAHYSGANHLVRHNNDVAESTISEQETFSGVDYFVVALVSSVYDCINSGLLYDKDQKEGDDPNFRGKLQVKKYIQKGANPFNLQTIQNIKQYDCNPNRILKAALEICASKAGNSQLRSIAHEMLPHFEGTSAARIDSTSIEYTFDSSLPRPDYEKALAIAKIILEGFASIEGSTDSFIPFYTINLDELFEIFIAYEIQKLLRSGIYTVHLQHKLPHPLNPALDSNFIAPDIEVTPTNGHGQRTIVIDTKNKYSLLNDSGSIKISNQDLFQMVYYCQAVGTNVGILVYPGDKDSRTEYLLMGSEGRTNYERKRNWRIDLSGTLRDTREAIAQFSQFVADCAKNEIL